MDQEKSYKNKDLIISKDEFDKSISNTFIGDDFIEQLEWAMLMVKGNFNQIRFADYLKPVTKNHFDKSYLMSSSLNESQKFFKPFSELQATPQMFPSLNIKHLMIGETIVFSKYKELGIEEKRNLNIKRKHVYERSVAFYKNDTESFYGRKDGYEVNPSFFNNIEKLTSINDFPSPISLNPNYVVPDNPIKYLTKEEIVDITKGIAMAYQIAFSMYYEWSIYIKENDGIGLIIPIEPSMLPEMYKTSLVKFDSKKRMLHFVKDHYRRRVAKEDEDYSIYIQKYLRGEHKFDYRGFYSEIIPPKYDLNRVKTRKKFIDANS